MLLFTKYYYSDGTGSR